MLAAIQCGRNIGAAMAYINFDSKAGEQLVGKQPDISFFGAEDKIVTLQIFDVDEGVA